MTARGHRDPTRWMFFACAALVLAHQVVGKAVRDGLFLSQFLPAELPKVIAAAALVSVICGLGFARLLSRVGPLRLVPAAFAAGAVLHAIEYFFLQSAGGVLRSVVITAVYLHLMGFGAILLSGFWSVANEVFDPRAAKRDFGRITGAGTAGGVAGGMLAERGAAWFGGESLLILLAVLHAGAAVVLWRIASTARTAGEPIEEEQSTWKAARDAFRHAPFLVNLSVLVALGTISATLLDYLFKTGAAASYGKGAALTRYFALFYTGGQILAFLTQTVLTPVALRRLGLGRTMQWHPGLVAAGAGASLLGPAWLLIPATRGLELVLRGSFLRSSHELFFTPVPPREKRAVKMLLDVSCDRMGDALGAAILQLLLLLGPQRAVAPILITTAVLAAVSAWIARRMDSAYSRVLEHGLVNRAVALNEADVQDSVTLAALLHTTLPFGSPERAAIEAPAAPPPNASLKDPVLARLAALRSGSAARIRAALAPDLPFEPAIVPSAIRLLAWREAFEWSRGFLLVNAHRAVGQLTDALLDPDQDFAIRRRIPHILAYTSSQRAVEGLMEALADPRFEIRFHVSRALEFLHRMTPGLRFERSTIMAAVERELSISPSIWDDRKLLDSGEWSDSQYRFLDENLRERANQSLEHVFSLLAILLPAEPLKVAFRALHSEDRLLRGLALEFLEDHLSAVLVASLRRLIEPAGGAAATRARAIAASESEATASNPMLVRGGSV